MLAVVVRARDFSLEMMDSKKLRGFSVGLQYRKPVAYTEARSLDHQKIVFRYKEIEGLLCRKHRKNSIVSIYRILGMQEVTFFRCFIHNFPPDSL
jgi:hypothetical protein